MVAIVPVWDKNYEPEKYDIIVADCNKVLEQVDFMELSTINIFNYQTGDHRYADILKSWQEGLPISPGNLNRSATGKISFSDGRHRTLLACLLMNDTVPIAVLKAETEVIKALIAK